MWFSEQGIPYLESLIQLDRKRGSMKPLIVGEAPGKGGDASKPVEGRVGARLAACAGLTFEEFLTTFDRVNLLQEQPQDNGNGTDFNIKAAGRRARELELSLEQLPLVMLLGKRVAAAFRMTRVEYFQAAFIGTVPTFVVPHPSGINRWYNDLDNELQMIRFMRGIVMRLQA